MQLDQWYNGYQVIGLDNSVTLQRYGIDLEIPSDIAALMTLDSWSELRNEYKGEALEIFKEGWRGLDGSPCWAVGLKYRRAVPLDSYGKPQVIGKVYYDKGKLKKYDHDLILIPQTELKLDMPFRLIDPNMAKFRFIVGHISVYLDLYATLGHCGVPYWETYNGEETERFVETDVKGLNEYLVRQLC